MPHVFLLVQFVVFESLFCTTLLPLMKAGEVMPLPWFIAIVISFFGFLFAFKNYFEIPSLLAFLSDHKKKIRTFNLNQVFVYVYVVVSLLLSILSMRGAAYISFVGVLIVLLMTMAVESTNKREVPSIEVLSELKRLAIKVYVGAFVLNTILLAFIYGMSSTLVSLDIFTLLITVGVIWGGFNQSFFSYVLTLIEKRERPNKS